MVLKGNKLSPILLILMADFDILIVRKKFVVIVQPKRIGMAQHQSAEKRARIAKRRSNRNAQAESRMKTAISRVRSAKDKATAEPELKKTVKLLDQYAAKGIIHKNRAANNKSNLTRFVNGLK